MTASSWSISHDAHDPSTANDTSPAIQFLLRRINHERNPAGLGRVSLDGMRQLANLLGDPHHQLNLVHVAGTKGKGSVSAMLSEILQAAGLKVGLFTSPHLQRMEERIVVNSQPISSGTFVNLMERIRPCVESLDRDRSPQRPGPTFFDIFTAAGFLHFAEAQVDIAIMEVGLGGRLDSTNICTPSCSVITSISRDHMKQLGTTIEQIAREKAGIIKHHIPVVSGATHHDAVAVIRDTATRLEAPLTLINQDYSASHTAAADQPIADASCLLDAIRYPCLDFRYARGDHPQIDWPAIQLSMLGDHQVMNAAVAVATAIQLQAQFLAIDERAVRVGLARTRLPARIELLQRRPTVIVDGGHNEASIVALCETLDQTWPDLRKRVIFGTTRGKDIRSMLQRLLKTADEIVLTQYLDSPRAADALMLQSIIRSLGNSNCAVRVTADPGNAWQETISTAKDRDLICVTGSLYLAAELRERMIHSVGAG